MQKTSSMPHLLEPMTEEDVLFDPVGEEVERVQGKETQMWKCAALLATGLLAICIPALCVMSARASKPLVRWMRINAMGQVQAINYNDLYYSPETVETRRYLEDWARDSYAMQQDTVLQTNRRRFYFMSHDQVDKELARDAKEQTVPQVAAGRLPGDAVKDLNVSFISFATSGATAKGAAEIYFTKVIEAGSYQREQKWQVTVAFEVDPGRVPKITETLLPEYQQLNPIGLMITSIDERMVGN